MTIVTSGDDATLDQIFKQLNKLVNVLEVIRFRGARFH
jgi:acetolactate synthase small subunit